MCNTQNSTDTQKTSNDGMKANNYMNNQNNSNPSSNANPSNNSDASQKMNSSYNDDNSDEMDMVEIDEIELGLSGDDDDNLSDADDSLTDDMSKDRAGTNTSFGCSRRN